MSSHTPAARFKDGGFENNSSVCLAHGATVARVNTYTHTEGTARHNKLCRKHCQYIYVVVIFMVNTSDRKMCLTEK